MIRSRRIVWAAGLGLAPAPVPAPPFAVYNVEIAVDGTPAGSKDFEIR
jgi:hypothetical protein